MWMSSGSSCARCVHIPLWRKLWLLLWPHDGALLWPELPGKQWWIYCSLNGKPAWLENTFLSEFSSTTFLFICVTSFFFFFFFCSTTTTRTPSNTCTGMERSRPTFLLPQTSQMQKVLPWARPLQTPCLLLLAARRKKTNPRIKLLNRYFTYRIQV